MENLTDEQIDALEFEQLNEAIFLALGWKWYVLPCFPEFTKLNPESKLNDYYAIMLSKDDPYGVLMAPGIMSGGNGRPIFPMIWKSKTGDLSRGLKHIAPIAISVKPSVLK